MKDAFKQAITKELTTAAANGDITVVKEALTKMELAEAAAQGDIGAVRNILNRTP